MERRNAKLLAVADGLPVPRPHSTFNEISNPTRCDERHTDPARYLMEPLEACVDAAVATGIVGVVVATRGRIEELFDELRTQLDARFTRELAERVLALPRSIGDAYQDQATEQAASDVAESQLLLHPGDAIALERAETLGRRNLRALTRWVTCLSFTRASGKVSRGFAVSGAKRWD